MNAALLKIFDYTMITRQGEHIRGKESMFIQESSVELLDLSISLKKNIQILLTSANWSMAS